MILCGAKAVQVGTCHWTEGSGCFARIANELEDMMRSKGYKSIEEFRGKLKPYMKHVNNISRKSSTVSKTDVTTDLRMKASSSDSTHIRELVIALLVLAVAYLVADKHGILVPLTF